MHFLEKTKIQRFLLTSFQYLDDLYPCSRMATAHLLPLEIFNVIHINGLRH